MTPKMKWILIGAIAATSVAVVGSSAIMFTQMDQIANSGTIPVNVPSNVPSTFENERDILLAGVPSTFENERDILLGEQEIPLAQQDELFEDLARIQSGEMTPEEYEAKYGASDEFADWTVEELEAEMKEVCDQMDHDDFWEAYCQ